MIGIISDTHDNKGAIKKALDLFSDCDLVIHCGDITSPDTVDLFSGSNIAFVKGNMDKSEDKIIKKVNSIGGKYLGDYGSLQYKGKTIGIIHGDDELRLESMINSGKFDLVLHGHTHKRRFEKIGNTIVINPGALSGSSDITVAKFDIENEAVEFLGV